MDCQEFDKALLNAVDFAFCSLGKSSQRAVYFHLRTTFRITKSDIPRKIEEFDEALRLIFKDGTVFLERLILRKLCEELGIKFQRKWCSDFVETVSEIRNMTLENESLVVSNFEEEVTVVKKKRGTEKIFSNPARNSYPISN